MTTIKINEHTKSGKAFLAMFDAFFKGVEGIEIVETDDYGQVNEERSTYNPEFVDMVLKSAKDKNSTEINPKDVWGSLGLK
jgi:hypothetical protein